MAAMGHFGKPALVLAGAALLGLILHLSVPYGYLDVREESVFGFIDDQAIWRSDAARTADLTDVGSGSPGLALTGFIVALAAGATLVMLGFVPLGVGPARWAGWGAGAIAAIGAILVLIPSLMWVGSGPGSVLMVEVGGAGTVPIAPTSGGVTGILDLMGGADAAGMVWVIGPVLSAVAGFAILWPALTVCAGVVRTENDFRSRAQAHLSGAKWAAIFLAVVLVVPWSIVKAPDASFADNDHFFYGAHSVFAAHEATDRVGDAWFGGLAFALLLMIWTAWVALAMALVGGLGGVLASVGAPREISRATHAAVFGTLLMLAATAIVYILAWATFWRPADGVDAQPGYFPILVVAPLALWVPRLLPLVRAALGAGNRRGSKANVQFD